MAFRVTFLSPTNQPSINHKCVSEDLSAGVVVFRLASPSGPTWASELAFKRGDTSPLDPIWPIFAILDLTREGRGETAAYPNLQY
ncbi:MAG TPA: hypothetical protein VMF56_08870 [Acidobacteriaceae bacterium]|nr:hypothetical protein [Acidobacteriaceae bacterium]